MGSERNATSLPEPVGQETCISPAGAIEQPYKRVDALSDEGLLVLAEGKGCVKVHNPDGSTFPAVTATILVVPTLSLGGSC